MHAALRLGDWHPLHAVHAAFELQPGPDAVGGVALACDGQRGVLVPAEVGEGLVEHGHVPAVALGVPDVHAGQVGGEECRLLAALPGLHLHDDVVGVVRIAGCQKVAELRLEFVDLGHQLGHLGGERRILGGQLLGGLEVTARGLQLAVGGHDRATAARTGDPPLRAAPASACSAGSDS